jgi:hypothetical protein
LVASWVRRIVRREWAPRIWTGGEELKIFAAVANLASRDC